MALKSQYIPPTLTKAELNFYVHRLPSSLTSSTTSKPHPYSALLVYFSSVFNFSNHDLIFHPMPRLVFIEDLPQQITIFFAYLFFFFAYTKKTQEITAPSIKDNSFEIPWITNVETSIHTLELTDTPNPLSS